MVNKRICILLFMLLIISIVNPVLGFVNTYSIERCNSVNYNLNIQFNPYEIEQRVLLTDTYEINEGQKLTVTLTVRWDPPEPEKPICMWPDTLVHPMPIGATLTPPGCNCGYGEVSSIFEWTPSIGQAGTYIVRFYAGESCYESVGYFEITIIVHPAGNNQPVVTITSPADGVIVNNPDVTLNGYITDDIGIISIGAHHEWTGDETLTSGTIPTTTYYPFEWNFDLHEGWNRITIFAEDTTGQTGEDSIEITYSTSMAIRFNQVDFYFYDTGQKIIDSYIGQIQVDIEELTSQYDISTGFLNVRTSVGWVVQNMLVTSLFVDDDMPYMVSSFCLRSGPPSGIKINSFQAYVDFATSPTPSFPSGEYTTFPIGSYTYNLEGPYFIPDIYAPIEFPCFPTEINQLEKVPNVQAANDQCGPAGAANSLQYLENKYPTKITVPHPNNPGLRGDGTLVGKLDGYMNRGVRTRADGDPIGEDDFIKGKLRYMENNSLGNSIKVKHQSHEDNLNDVKVGNLTSKYKGKPSISWIIQEIKLGEDVEAGLIYPNGGGHIVRITGAGYICGIPYITHISDHNQTNRDPTDTKGCDSEDFELLKDDGKGNLTTIGGHSSINTRIEFVVSESPNDPPNKPNRPNGPNRGKPNTPITFTTNTPTDPNGDGVVKYEWDFDGDGKVDETTNSPSVQHTFPNEGNYNVRVRARDEHGATSQWSDPHGIEIPKSKNISNYWLIKILERHPLIYPLFKQIFLK